MALDAAGAVEVVMQTFCDRCNETVDHPIGILADPELGELATELGYRSVCPGCYDDLVVEAADARQPHGEGDRRSEERIPVKFALTLEAVDESVPKQAVLAEDISPNGLGVRGVGPLDRGTVVRVITDGSAGAVEAVAIVELVWSDGETLHAGLHLVEASASWEQLVSEHAARYEPL
jgi:hypothetical protein